MEFKRVLGNEIKWSYAFKFPLCQSFDLTEYVDTRNLTPWLFWFTFNESYVQAGLRGTMTPQFTCPSVFFRIGRAT